ncbi:GGDEF domain-containing protein [Anaerocolumna sp. MB42-C2]|uniref:GGDEF domain-containing protein n=1 Tax=Anaerocolumna sp. MB42-C2 TaxID=3070997 RepID=UPI0027E004F4|nr:GGDEF domain-containing protein [Anaerocolumna sp. MB42-C2]WMJ88131.1 GGDEF domain-containing protein [Anaerocolumna sp. MB42-C2]
MSDVISDIMKQELDYIIEKKQIKSVFQPIISLKDGNILGYEALSRITCKSIISNTEEIFRLAGEHNRLWDLELLCRVKSLEAAFNQMKFPYDKKLFVNVNPRVMHDIKFRDGFTKEYLNKYNITPENIIFEITEREAINDMESFQGAVEHYKKQHYKIAIDDAGAGYSGLNLISDIHPHFLKLDMKMIRNIDKDNFKYVLVKSLIEFSRITNISLIAEGIETKEELKALINLGVQYGQGYYIQKPNEVMAKIDTDLIQFIEGTNQKKNNIQGIKLSGLFIENITKQTPIISPFKKVEKVFDDFKENSDIYGMCVVLEDKVMGIITRENLILKVSGRYGFSLYQRKDISEIMDKEYLEVDYHTPINTVSYLAMERDNSKIYDMIVVTRDGKYFGTVTVKDLLQKTTEIDIANAKNLNPLSGLPGNLIIENEISQCITFRSEYSILYIDIDNFKAYNDVYGIEKGDQVIKVLSAILLNYKEETTFIGHVGGDDFIITLDNYKWDVISDSIISDFEKEAQLMYNEEDRERGFITSANRHGVIEEFPLASLTISVVSNKNRTYYNGNELTEELARLKKKGKQYKGSICFSGDTN